VTDIYVQGATSTPTEGIDVEARQLQVDAHWAADTASRCAMALSTGGAHSISAAAAAILQVRSLLNAISLIQLHSPKRRAPTSSIQYTMCAVHANMIVVAVMPYSVGFMTSYSTANSCLLNCTAADKCALAISQSHKLRH
jgi:hypothetical protein